MNHPLRHSLQQWLKWATRPQFLQHNPLTSSSSTLIIVDSYCQGTNKILRLKCGGQLRFVLSLFEENRRKESSAHQNDSEQRLFVQDVLLATLTDEFASIEIGTAEQSDPIKDEDSGKHVTRIKLKATVPSQKPLTAVPISAHKQQQCHRVSNPTGTDLGNSASKLTQRRNVANLTAADQLNGIPVPNGNHLD